MLESDRLGKVRAEVSADLEAAALAQRIPSFDRCNSHELFLVVGGATLYGFVGVLCMLLGGNFLDYSVLMSDPVAARQVGIIAIELGVGMAVCGALLSIFHAFAAREPR